MEIIASQLELRPALPNVYGALDYRIFRDTLVKMDEILIKSGLEHNLIMQTLNQEIEEQKLNGTPLHEGKEIDSSYKKLKHALRCNIGRHLTGESYRLFSMRLAVFVNRVVA